MRERKLKVLLKHKIPLTPSMTAQGETEIVAGTTVQHIDQIKIVCPNLFLFLKKKRTLPNNQIYDERIERRLLIH